MNLTIPMLRTPYFYECLSERRILPDAKLRDMDGDTLTLTPQDPVEDVVQFLKDMPTLKGYKGRVARHVFNFCRLYYRKLDPLRLTIAVSNAGFICLPALVHNHAGIFKRAKLKQTPRTYITTTEPIGPLYEPLTQLPSKYSHYFKPTMITDHRGELAAEVAEDLARPTPSAIRVG
jgi:hypothetical protein